MQILVTNFESLIQKVHCVRQLIMNFMWDENKFHYILLSEKMN